MSDSINKYHEMLQDGLVSESTINSRVINYTELQLVETVANIARLYRDADPTLILQMAKDELAVQKVCD